jgi:hypothetical protein
MDNAAILAANGLDYNGIDAFRTNNENLKQDAVSPRTRSAQSENNQVGKNSGVNDTDLVELSRESMDLAAYAENANLTAAQVETPEARPVEETLMEPANANLVTSVGTGPETTSPTALSDVTVENEGQNTIINTNTTNTGITLETAPAATQEITTTTEQVTTVSTTTPSPENIAVETVPVSAEPTAPQTISELAASTAIPEQPTGTGVVQEQSIVPTLEEQANELTQINNSLAVVSNLTATSSGPEPATPAESTRNEQQILLQQLSTQLAQVIPPASVFSVVG